jgi:LacI family transcriptional regulator, galactose operon repressor
MATMKDVAKLAGVSIATVSSTLSGRSFVSAELKQRVETAIRELGYAPNAVASGLKRGTSSLIGLIVPDITNPFFTELVHCIQRRAAEAGFIVLLGVSDDQQAREMEWIRLMRSHQVAGTLVIPCGSEEDCLNLSRLAAGMPIVAADNAPPGMAADTVVLDNRKAAELATSHLLSLGHKAIATISGPPHRFVSQERFVGFKMALEANGLSVNPRHMRRGDFHVGAAREAGLALLRSAPRPTAIFVANNQMLIGVMQAMAEVGLSVPHDVSIVSIDDFPWAAAFMPALTTVRQPIDAMAEAAIERLKLRIGGLLEDPCRMVLAPELVVRQSCQAPVV